MDRRMAGWAGFLALVVMLAACSGGGHADSPAKDSTVGAEGGTPGARRSWAGDTPSPDFPPGLSWFNVDRPLSMDALRGKVVLLDFWTLGCINCQHIIPDLKRLETEFGDALVVVGVHSGKYDREHDDQSIRDAIGKYGLAHPVVNDPDFLVWRTFGATAWPTLVLIDPAGNLVGGHAGEGVYPLFQPILASLIEEFEGKSLVDRRPLGTVEQPQRPGTVLLYPSAVLADERGGRLFIADAGHNRILMATLAGELLEAVGTGKEGFADGSYAEASFRQPQGLALSADGATLYVADTRNHAVRAVDLERREVRTIAGTGQQLDRLPGEDAAATQTALASPWGLLERERTLYIAMAGVHQLWAMDLARDTISVYAGTSREGINDGERRREATLAQPSGLASNGDYLYWVDPESSSVRQVSLSNGQVRTIAGTGLFDFGDKDGVGSMARLEHPQGIAFLDGQLFVADTYNHKVRKVDPATREVRTVAGSDASGWEDGVGAAARLNEPGGVSAGGGRLYIADTNNHLIRVLEPASGRLTTLTLTNLAVAVPGGEGTRVQLERQVVAPGAANLEVRVSAPGGYKLNSLGGSKLTLTSSNVAVLELGEREVSWDSDEGAVEFPVPVRLGEGQATLTAVGTVYYCRAGEAALCFVQQLEVVLPVAVATDATGGGLRLEVVLPGQP